MKNKKGGNGFSMTQIMKNCTEMNINGDGIINPTNITGGAALVPSSNQSGGNLNNRFKKINFNFNIDLFRESVDPNNKDYIRPSTNKKRLDQFTKYQETGEAPKKTNEQAGIKHATG